VARNNKNIPSSKNQEGPFFKLLVEGKFLPNQIKIKKGFGILKRNLKSELLIENEWQKFLTSGFKLRSGDTKPSRYHFVGAKVKNGQLIIKVDPTISYRDAIGGRSLKLKKMGRKFVPVPIGVVAAIIAKTNSGEEKLGIAIRNLKHDYKPGGYSVTAGGNAQTQDKETPTETVIREIKEETGLSPKEIYGLICRGITYNIGSSTAGVIFFVQTHLTPVDISSKIHDDENRIVFIPIRKKWFEKFIIETALASVEDGLAAMLLLGKDRYGEKWFEKMMKSLSKIWTKYIIGENRKKMEQKVIRKLKKLTKNL